MWQITVSFNGNRQAAYLLDEPHVVIGRGRSAHIPLDNNPIVSRQHATITDADGTHIIEDLGGANGTFVNDKRLVGEHKLVPGDTIVLGKHSLRYEESTRAAVSLRVERRPRPGYDPVATQTIPPLGAADIAASALGGPQRLGPSEGTAPWDSSSPPLRKRPESMAGQERTMAASKEELERLLEQMKLKSNPHLSFQRKNGGVKYISLPQDIPYVIGHAEGCDLKLKGRSWWPFGNIAGQIVARKTHNGRRWWLIAKSPLLTPVSVNGKKVKQKRELRRGSVISVGLRKLRFSPGETD
jgi:pSer/pThr/pTyr-binding forkhead associated (FHA) protein